MIKPYFLRCKESDYPELVSLAKDLGIIREVDGEIFGINGCDWHLPGDDGKLYENGQYIKDEMGIPYIHCNLNLRFDLLERATALSGQYPELAAALSSPGKFFLLDDQGQPRKPKAPQCTFGNYP